MSTEGRRLPVPAYLIHGAIQLTAYGVIRAAIIRIWASNPGSIVEKHFFDHNVRLLLKPGEADALAGGRAGVIALAFVLIACVGRDWGQKPDFLRKSAVVLFWSLAGLTLLFGWLNELRDYYEVYPVLVALAGMTVARYAFGLDIVSTDKIEKTTMGPDNRVVGFPLKSAGESAPFRCPGFP